jgi:hypothetical protein
MQHRIISQCGVLTSHREIIIRPGLLRHQSGGFHQFGVDPNLLRDGLPERLGVVQRKLQPGSG